MTLMKGTLMRILFAFLPAVAMAQSPGKFVLSNPTPIVRSDELVVLKRTDLEKQIGRITNFIELRCKGAQVPVQFDDLDRDGKWDEAVFLYSFRALESATFTIRAAKTRGTHTLVRAHVLLRKKNSDDAWGPNLKEEIMPLRNPATDFTRQPLPLYLTEGPAWENDKVGFRLYFDVRNGKDIWGKRTAGMVLDSVGTRVEPSYHNWSEWGMDILKVGPSLGAGGLALLVQFKGQDSLMRLGGQHITHTRFVQVVDGPVRAIFRMHYTWTVNGSPVNLQEEVCIWGGQYFYESRVTLSGAPAGTRLVSGIPDLNPNQFQVFDTGASVILLTHGRQSENKDLLGMALMAPKKQLSFIGTAPATGSDVKNAYLMVMEMDKDKSACFRFYAGWEQSNALFASMSNFKNLLQTDAQKILQPIKVKW